MSVFQKLYDNASPELKQKLATWDFDFEDGKFDVCWEDPAGFLTEYRAMGHTYYLEERDVQEGQVMDAKGVDTLEEAIDIFISLGKYGPWSLYTFSGGKWHEAKLVRVGTEIVLNWKPKDRY